jgi:hypothetical protein
MESVSEGDIIEQQIDAYNKQQHIIRDDGNDPTEHD